MNPDGTGVVRLTTSAGDAFDPAWSPDGAKIAFTSTRDDPSGEIYVMRVAGASPAQLTTQRSAERSPR